jgi:hypothetical protein
VIWRYLLPLAIAALAAIDLANGFGKGAGARLVSLLLTYIAPYTLMTVGFCVWFLDDNLFHGVPYFLFAALLWMVMNRKRQRLLESAAD